MTTTQALTLPGTSKTGWKLDAAAVRQAIEFFGIAAPVEVKLSAGTRKVGCAKWREGVHVITVTTHHSLAGASKTLWHELTHAAQREYLGADFGPAYRAESARVGYRANRFEVEARDVADAMAADYPLAKVA